MYKILFISSAVMTLAATSLTARETHAMTTPVEIGSRLELFVDDHLVERMDGVAFRLHEPVRQPPANSPLITRGYATIIKDGDTYRAYYRSEIPGHGGERSEREITCYAESDDGIEWSFPDLGIYPDVRSAQGRNVVLAGRPPFSHNFSPFLDSRPDVEPEARFKALAGSHKTGLHAFQSADGLRWSKIQEAPVLTTPPWSRSIYQWNTSIRDSKTATYGFDSQNVAFWCEVENAYVCFVRTWNTRVGPQGQRGISRATSPDFVTWSPLVDTDAHLPGEQLYTSQTHPYFRAPHIYIATPARFTQGIQMGQPVEGNNGSSDILLMTMRAGEAAYRRTFREAFIRPGLDPERWARKANYVALNVVPTGTAEMSIYHETSGHRYALRTDGFISVRAGGAAGELVTKPLIFDGNALIVNYSTSAAGSVRVELQDAAGRSLPGFGLEDCSALIGDSIAQRVHWKGDPDLGALAGEPVRLRVAMQECDVYSFRFRRE